MLKAFMIMVVSLVLTWLLGVSSVETATQGELVSVYMVLVIGLTCMGLVHKHYTAELVRIKEAENLKEDTLLREQKIRELGF